MTEAARMNPYTKAMVNCLVQLEGQDTSSIDKQTSQFLTNMVQGRFLQYLAERMSAFHELDDPELEKQLMMCLMGMMSQSFFAVFREKVNEKPEIALMIAQKITHHETAESHLEGLRTDKLYLGIVRKYFDYENIEMIFKWIAENPEIQKILILAQFKRLIEDPHCQQSFQHILYEDKEGITPMVFTRHLEKQRKERLVSLVETGDWQIEARFIQERVESHPELKESFLASQFQNR
jgi:hypothetical protein